MIKLIRKAAVISATIAASSFAFATAVAAQTYTYGTTTAADSAAAAGVLGTSAVVWCCVACIPLVILAALAYYVYQDAQKYEVENAPLWALLTLITGLVGLLIYFLAIRPDAVKKYEAKHGTSTPKAS